MTTFDLQHLDQLSPEQRQQFDQLLDQFPQLASKMDTARQLNTPGAAQRQAPPPPPRPSIDQVLDYRDFEQPAAPPRQPPVDIPKIQIDPANNMFGSFTPEEEQPKDKAPKAKAPAPKPQEPSVQPPEIRGFSPQGKLHPVLAKLRTTLGMTGLKPPYVVSVGGMLYEMHALARGEVSRASVMAAMASLNDQEFKYKIENAITAFAVDKIDGVPTADVFQVPTSRVDDVGVTIQLLTYERRELGAQQLFDFLDQSPSELTDTLAQHYNQEFPPLELIEKDKKTARCGAPNCQYTRIIPLGDDSYCPYHGVKLADEDALPNPS